MKALPLLALLLAIPAFADDWPQKGDTVYVAAELTVHVSPKLIGVGGAVVSGVGQHTHLPACAPLTRSWSSGRFKDETGGLHILAGDWTPYLKRTLGECRASTSLPTVITKGVRHSLAD